MKNYRRITNKNVGNIECPNCPFCNAEYDTERGIWASIEQRLEWDEEKKQKKVKL